MRIASAFLAASLLLPASPGWAVPSDLPFDPADPAASATEQANLEKASAYYQRALAVLEQADALEAAARSKKGRRAAAARADVEDKYAEARELFQDATNYVPGMAEAWNGIGYTQRKLGSPHAALAAYEQALALRPAYPEAIEYRAEAYLDVQRIAEAKEAYLDLFASHRALSDQLLGAMKRWIATQRADKTSEMSAAELNEFDAWVKERATIAAQTAGLTRAGAAAGWR